MEVYPYATQLESLAGQGASGTTKGQSLQGSLPGSIGPRQAGARARRVASQLPAALVLILQPGRRRE